ncbi:nuclear transport factor 2 family protein [Pseudooceanicola aestuarii]|uniref:nuclear transport factor 2 family protein n=1 Tax=Pseudooceanicola aestuarii TaxID=2697319 RepID=UPI0013D11E94|nr:nuclear transport factor 2 family protein [Pseudooceanicola aestuarii]
MTLQPKNPTPPATEDPTALWKIEETLWTGATDAIRRRLAPGCLVAFPGMGILQGEAIMESLMQAPRWSEVAMSERRRHDAGDLAVLAYCARALRDGDAPCMAICTSSWRDIDGAWRLVQHQQAPA